MMLSIEEKKRIQCRFAALLERPRTTVNYQKQAALKKLRKEMEKMKNEIETDTLEVIEKEVGGDTASLLEVEAYHRPRIAYLSHGDTKMQDLVKR